MQNAALTRLVEPDAAAEQLAAPGERDHFVHFYEDDANLVEVVARFLGAGITAGDQVIAIASPNHVHALRQRMVSADVYRALADGQLVFIDARETLSRFMTSGVPNRERFHRTLELILMRATKGKKGLRVRAYGEMVDLLWRDGMHSAAIELEELWNEAARAQAFSLLCSYVMASFYKSGHRDAFADVCKAHSHVFRPEHSARFDAFANSPAGSELQTLKEQVRALELENSRLRELDTALRNSTSERLQQGEDRFRLLVESVKDYAIFILDPDGCISTWNAGSERIKGYLAEEIIGRHVSTFYSAEDIAAGKWEAELAAALRDGRFEDEGWRIRKDGSRFWANFVITALRNPLGEVVGFAKVTRDLTERLAAEHERLRLARMEEASDRKDEFLAIIGHELRNPLAPLVTAAHLMRERGGQATEKEMEIVERQLRQMTRIVDDLLDASRAMRGKIELTPMVMEIAEVISSAVALTSSLIETRKHGLIVDVPAQGLPVHVDPDRMAQVFGNILHNAAKYTPKGGRIRVHAWPVGDAIRVSVEDNGQGIAAYMLDRIFDLFTQGDEGLERAGAGLGIGLAVARTFVHAHHGDLEVHSEGVGHGSRFTIRLPRATARPQAASTPRARMSQAPIARRVLIADDTRDIVETMRTLLEQRGHELRVAYDGPTALELCAQFKPDVVFLDIGLPRMNGYDVAQHIRQLPSCQTIRIVAVSGYARDDDRQRALASGFSDHLAKPYDIEALVRNVERDALDRR